MFKSVDEMSREELEEAFAQVFRSNQALHRRCQVLESALARQRRQIKGALKIFNCAVKRVNHWGDRLKYIQSKEYRRLLEEYGLRKKAE